MKKILWLLFLVGIAVAVVKYSTAAGRWYDAETSDRDSAGA